MGYTHELLFIFIGYLVLSLQQLQLSSVHLCAKLDPNQFSILRVKE